MARPERLDDEAIARWCASTKGWAYEGNALRKHFRFADYPSTLAFVMRLGFAAEKRDHHPDLVVGWGRVEVRWSTHDAGGVTPLDLEMAASSDELAGS